MESFTQEAFETVVGHVLDVQQVNVSVSARGTVRGIHFAAVPPGQSKYVQCYQGAILDVVVDVRVGSPTFGEWEAFELNCDSRQALYIAEGLGHAFCALSDTATVGYMCSAPYAPKREHGVNPTDPALRIKWPDGVDLRLSAKDAAAPTLAAALDQGILPSYSDCVAHYDSLKTKSSP